MDIFEAMALRRSSRAYTTEKVSAEELEKLLFAANSAPVGGAHYENIHLTVVQEPALREQLRAAGAGANSSADPFYGAPLVILVSARARQSSPGVEIANAACLVEHMHLAATALGLGSVYIWGCLPGLRADAALKTRLGIPDGFEPLSAIAVGHVAEAPAPRTFDSQYACDLFL